MTQHAKTKLIKDLRLQLMLGSPENKSRIGLRVGSILQDVCAAYHLSIQQLMSDRRDANTLKARYEAIARLWNETSLTKAAIGRLLNRDHTTVIYALERMGFCQKLGSKAICKPMKKLVD